VGERILDVVPTSLHQRVPFIFGALEEVERIKPRRVVFDSLSELRLLAGNPLRYRRHILALKQFLGTRQCTTMLLDDMTATDQDLQMQSIAHGVIRLEQLSPEYGSERRRLRVVKLRGVAFRSGFHDYIIRYGGIEVFPRLVASEHRHIASRVKHSSGIHGIDQLLGGGIEYALAPNWSAKVEYLYVDLGSFNCGLNCGAGLFTDNVSFHTNILRAGVNYKF
jgi:hypothetical protein